MRRLHAQSRGGAGHCTGCRQRPRQPLRAARHRRACRRSGQRHRPRGRARARRLQGLRAPRRCRVVARANRRPGFPAPRRRGGLRRRQHHAALALGVVGGGRRHVAIGAGAVPLAVRADRAAHHRLRRPAVLCLRRAGAQIAPAEHGRADLARRPAGNGHEPLPDHARQRAGLFRCRRHAALLPADRPLPRPAHARACLRRRGQSARIARRNRQRRSSGWLRRARLRPPAGAGHAGPHRGRRAFRRRRAADGRTRRDRRKPDHRRDRAAQRRAGRPHLRRHAQSVGAAGDRGHRQRPEHAAGRDRPPDDGRRAGARPLRPSRRPRRALLCARGTCSRTSRPFSAGC